MENVHQGDVRHSGLVSPVGEDGILRQYEPKIRSFARKGTFRYMPVAEVEQSARIGLLRALRRFDPHQKADLWTYAQEFMKAEVLKDWRGWHDSNVLPVDHEVGETVDPDSSKPFEDAEVAALADVMPRAEKNAFVGTVVLDLSLADIGRLGGVSRAAASQALKRAVVRLTTELKSIAYAA